MEKGCQPLRKRAALPYGCSTGVGQAASLYKRTTSEEMTRLYGLCLGLLLYCHSSSLSPSRFFPFSLNRYHHSQHFLTVLLHPKDTYFYRSFFLPTVLLFLLLFGLVLLFLASNMGETSKLPQLAMLGTSLMVGLTMVMGINAINSAPSFMLDYYKYLNGSENTEPRSPLFWKQILNFYTVVTLVAQAVHEPTNLTSFMCRFSLLFRLEVSVVVMIIELLVILIMPQTHVSEYSAIAALMIVAYLGGAARGYFENTGYALFGPCPPVMLSGMLVGSALSGAVLSIVQIILLASMSGSYSSVLTQSLIYFCMAIGIIFVAGLLLSTLLYNPYARRHIAEFRSHRSPWANIYRRRKTAPRALSCRGSAAPDAAESDVKRIAANSSSDGDHEMHGERDRDQGNDLRDDVLFDDRRRGAAREGCEWREHEETTGASSAAAGEGTAKDTPRAAKGELVSEVEKEDGGDLTTAELLQDVRVWSVIKRIWPMMLTCLLTFGTTYLIYPGVILAVDSSSAWYTTLVMTTYNFADLFGRIASMWKRLWPPRRWVIVASIVRIVLVPLMVLCGLHKIPTQVPAYIFTAMMGLSNGFIGTLSMVYSPDTPSLTTDGERAMAGQLTGACLLIGCAVGSLLQLAIVIPFA